MTPHLMILGCRGVPADHGGFETFAQQIALFLTGKGWAVSVYCQADESKASAIDVREWRGVTRLVVPTRAKGSLGSIIFDWKSILHAMRRPGVLLVLGFNTGVFAVLPRLLGRRVMISMDGFEWRRTKWSPPVQLWFWMNARLAAALGITLIADHPLIREYYGAFIRHGKVVMIPYGAAQSVKVGIEPLRALNLTPGGYFLIVCRIEPENSVLEIVRAFSAGKGPRSLVVLGRMDNNHPYQAAVLQAAGDKVKFLGAIYEPEITSSLRKHARAYCHGHRVGGTNPSLVESLSFGSAIIAHDNKFNRWTAGEGQFYFQDVESCVRCISQVDTDDEAVTRAQAAAAERFQSDFTLDSVLYSYEKLLIAYNYT
ncbi:MAG: DUF1972 domain-containing protein [Methylocella sp.]